MLSFHNSKIVLTGKKYGLRIANFDLPIGFTCPAANLCHSRVIVNDEGHRERVDYGEFPCYKAKSELLYTGVYNMVHENWNASKLSTFVDLMAEEITSNGLNSIRFHSGGDFYDFTYFKKWLTLAHILPDVEFWGYTKQATFKHYLDKNPMDNFRMVYSFGGTLDSLAFKYDLTSCTVVTDDYVYRTSKTDVEFNNGLFWYKNPIGKKRGQIIYSLLSSPIGIPLNSFVNHLKGGRVEPLACLPENKASDYEYIKRDESFGILFH